MKEFVYGTCHNWVPDLTFHELSDLSQKNVVVGYWLLVVVVVVVVVVGDVGGFPHGLVESDFRPSFSAGRPRAAGAPPVWTWGAGSDPESPASQSLG